MVVIVFVTDPSGQYYPNFPKKKVTYSSKIFIKPSLFHTQVEPGETFATTKEEEWVSKKKTEVTNTKQIETRVKRQVVLEDGKVVEDSGPMVTTNTSEDTETQEHHQTELRKLGDDEVDGPKAVEGGADNVIAERSNWVSVPNPDGVVREVKERKIISREETEEVKETEDVQHLGDITDEEFLSAVRSGEKDLRKVLRSNEAGQQIVSTGPKLIHESRKTNKVTDTEDTRELSSVRPDGKIVTETERTTEHEEIKDDELPEEAPDQNFQKESSQRYLKTKEQEDVDYVADGVNIGHEMRFRTETMEAERRGDGVDEPDIFDSLSARARRRANNRQQNRQRGLENDAGISPLDRKDALTRKPLDFDQEEETRKVETSKWLEHHFGSESRSSNNSTVEDEEQPPKTSFFNVTIKSQPARADPVNHNSYVTAIKETTRVYSPVEPERDRNHTGGYFKGITEWSEQRQEHQYMDRRSPLPYLSPPYPSEHQRRQSPIPDYKPANSPLPDYRPHHSPVPDYSRPTRISPKREVINITPTPPRRTKNERQRQRVVEDRTRYDSEYRNTRFDDSRNQRIEPVEEPPPDYSPPNPSQMPASKKPNQKTRFAVDPPPKPPKSGNIIGQSIRKLVGKIRSASAERKAKQRARRSPSPSYQQGHVIDSNIGHSMERLDRHPPVQRYYLGEDPFAGSIYGRENKYEGAKPQRNSRRPRDVQEERRSQSTLGRFSKSSSRLVSSQSTEERNSQTLPRHPSKHEPPSRLGNKSNSTINVSIINTVSSPRKVEGPAKPVRTYKSNLSRSKSLNVHAGLDPSSPGMYTSNPHLHRLDQNAIGLKSPGLISSLNRSQRDINEDVYTTRFARNGVSEDPENKRVFLSTLKNRAPELFKTLEEPDSYTPMKNGRSYDIYEPPTRLRDTKLINSTPNRSVVRRGSASSTDYSETYYTTKRNDDPLHPSVTNTTKSFSKRTVPSQNGRAIETIQSSETKITRSSHSRSGSEPAKTLRQERWYNSSGSKPVVIEVRNYK
nr:serine/arginine repetitive matrix protein 1 [Leptinotarsa decemlineata]